MRLQRALRRVFASAVAFCLAVMTVGASTTTWNTAAAQPSPGEDLFDDIYRRGAPIEKTLHTVSANFVETSTSTLLKTPQVSRGRLIGRRPSQVRLDYTGADARTVVVNGNALSVNWPARQVRETRDIGGTMRRAQRFFAATTPTELRKHFEIVAAEATDRAGTWRVTFTPKRRQMRDGVERVHLWINRTSLTLDAMKLDYPGGDTRLMEFADIRLNPPVEASVFASASAPLR